MKIPYYRLSSTIKCAKYNYVDSYKNYGKHIPDGTNNSKNLIE